MEFVGLTAEFWRGKSVFVTGHTGFKGGWLCLWLHTLGARVHGYALTPPTQPSLFSVAYVYDSLASSTIKDIRELTHLKTAMWCAKPDVVFHLAAQPIVRRSYTTPVETYSVNVMGTVNLFEAVRSTPSVRAVVNVTTDKCYDNQERIGGYREEEALGGSDPYSSSKACSEIVTGAYRRSFLQTAGIGVASARAGNVVGGGDWAADRLIPDILRAFEGGTVLKIRAPDAIRPWQHVLEPLSGYLSLAERLYHNPEGFAEAWNFGPSDEDAWPVRRVTDYLASIFPNACWEVDTGDNPHESKLLRLDSSKARNRLHWCPKWNTETALEKTSEWRAAWRDGRNLRDFSEGQIIEYCEWKS